MLVGRSALRLAGRVDLVGHGCRDPRHLRVHARAHPRSHALAASTAALMLASPHGHHPERRVPRLPVLARASGCCSARALLAGLRRRSPWLLVVGGILLGVALRDPAVRRGALGRGDGRVRRVHDLARVGAPARAVALVALGFLPFLVLPRSRTTASSPGQFTTFPFTAKEPLDKFGFGYRRLMPRIVRYRLHARPGVRGSAVNGVLRPAVPRSGATSGVLLAGGRALVPSHATAPPGSSSRSWSCSRPGYFVFWGNRLASGFAFLSGPVYFLPLFVSLSRLHRHRAAGAVASTGARPLIVVLCVVVVATVPFLYDKSAMNRRISAAQEPWRRRDAMQLPGRSLVIVRDSGPYLLHLQPVLGERARSRRPGPLLGRPRRRLVRADRALPGAHAVRAANEPSAAQQPHQAHRRQGPDRERAPDHGDRRSRRAAAGPGAQPDRRGGGRSRRSASGTGSEQRTSVADRRTAPTRPSGRSCRRPRPTFSTVRYR